MDFGKPFEYTPSDSILQKIKIIPTKEKLTASAGLGTIVEIFDQSGMKEDFIKCLPERTSPRSQGSYKLALNMICGFLHGFDCLDDHDDFDGDEAIKALFGEGTPASRTLGDFLRDFEPEHIQRLNEFLGRMGWALTASLHKQLPIEHKPRSVCLDMDSTSHPQSGNKIEGVGWDYKNQWCLDSQVVYSNLGFCHGFQLRGGGTKSGVGASQLFRSALHDGKKQIERKLKGNIFARGDSAYCQQEVIKTLVEKGVLFTLTAHDGATHWKDRVETDGLNWQPWIYTSEQIEKAQGKSKELPEVDLSRFYWTPKWSEKEEAKLTFAIVVKRTLNKERFEELRRKNTQIRLISDDGYLKEDPYDYYAVVTNFPLDLATERAQAPEQEVKMKRYSLQEVMEFHQKRGNCENFIREEKYGYDLSHFPCLKMNANHAYGLLAMVAHNLLRWVALLMRPEKPLFSKKLRKRFIFYPGKVVKHARQVYLRIIERGYEEVMKLREAWGFQPEKIPLRYSSA